MSKSVEMSSAEQELLSLLSHHLEDAQEIPVFASQRADFDENRSIHPIACFVAGKSVVGLSLRNLGLTRIPEEVFQFKKLRYLDVSGNDIGSVPPALTELSDLRNLVLAGNRIGDLPNLSNLTSLIVLDVDDNKMVHVGADVCLLKQLKVMLI